MADGGEATADPVYFNANPLSSFPMHTPCYPPPFRVLLELFDCVLFIPSGVFKREASLEGVRARKQGSPDEARRIVTVLSGRARERKEEKTGTPAQGKLGQRRAKGPRDGSYSKKLTGSSPGFRSCYHDTRLDGQLRKTKRKCRRGFALFGIFLAVLRMILWLGTCRSSPTAVFGSCDGWEATVTSAYTSSTVPNGLVSQHDVANGHLVRRRCPFVHATASLTHTM